MKKCKVMILILGSTHPQYKELEDAIKETWFKNYNSDVEILFYKNSEKKSAYLEDVTLYLPIEDGHHNIGHKTIKAFEYILKRYDFKYIFRTNYGSYVQVENLLKFLEDKPEEKYYSGINGIDVEYFQKEITFASGSGYFLSKDLVKLICSKKNTWNHNAMDDVSLGLFLSNFKIFTDKLATRKDLCDGEEKYLIGNREVDYISKHFLYHFRCRSQNRNIDINNIKTIHDEYTNRKQYD